jgi:hypothetical protein
MWNWWRRLWKKPEKIQVGPRALGADEVHSLAGEIVELSRLAEMLHPEDDEFLTRVRRIRSEMDELRKLSQRPEFRRLSEVRLRNLDKGLTQTRKQLLDMVKKAPAPTSTLQ